MDKKPSKCRLRVMKFEKNAIYSSKHEMRAQSLKPAKVSRARKRSRSPEPQASTTESIKEQDRKYRNRVVGTIPDNNHMFIGRSSSIAGELKRIFSPNYSELNSTRNAHQVGNKAKKTKRKAKGRRKKHNFPDYLRNNDETVPYRYETNQSPRRARNESLRYEQKLISPSMYYLSAGDSIERELCKAPRVPKVIDESCDCLIAEFTYPNASIDTDSLSRRDNRKYSQDCARRREDQCTSVERCTFESRHIRRKKCDCMSCMPEYPTLTTRQTVQNIDIPDDSQTSPVAPRRHTAMCNTPTSILYKNASCACPSLNKNITRCTIEKTTQPSTVLSPKMLPNTNTYACIGCNSSELLTNKSPSSNTNFRSYEKGIHTFYCSSCAGDPIYCNLPDLSHKNVICECPSSKWSLQRAKSIIRSFTVINKRPVDVQTECRCPASISNVSVQTGGSIPSAKGRLSSLGKPKFISCSTSDKIPKTTQYKAPSPSPVHSKHEVRCECPRCKVPFGYLQVKRTPGYASSQTPVTGGSIDIKPSCPRTRRKPPRRTRMNNKPAPFCAIKKVKSLFKCGVQKKCNMFQDAETGCLDDSCRAGPRTVYALFPPFFTRSTCYFYYIVYIIAMIVCSPFVAIIFFCRFVTSPIRPSGYDCGEICPPCIPPRPCPHVLIRLFKSRQLFDKPTGSSKAQPITSVDKRQKRPSVSKYKTKRKREIKQHSTSSVPKEFKNGTKTLQNVPVTCDCPAIPSKSSTSRSRETQKTPICCKPPPCDCRNIIPRSCSKASSLEYETILSKYSKVSSCGCGH